MARGFPDFTGPKVGVYLEPEWAAREGIDKNLRASLDNAPHNWAAQIDYTVPDDVDLYITAVQGRSMSTLAEDADNNQICSVAVRDYTIDTYLFTGGGNGGLSAILNKPLVIPAGHEVFCYCTNMANHNCTVTVSVQGYEV